jgi:TRAP-type C4-dicarboxylate transport system permease small subunit
MASINFTPKVLGRALAFFDAVARIGIIGALSLMTLVVSAQVLFRYGFNYSLDWAEEFSRLCFVWSVFLAVPLGIARGAHVGINLFVAQLLPLIQERLARLMALMALGLMLIVLYQSIRELLGTWYESLIGLDISTGWFTVPLAIGAGHSALHLLNEIFVGPPAPGVPIE